jgi:hypothetical protein
MHVVGIDSKRAGFMAGEKIEQSLDDFHACPLGKTMHKEAHKQYE